MEGNDDEILSEKFCCCTIKVRKKIIKAIKWIIVYVEVSLRIANGVSPVQAIGLPIPPQTPEIMRSIHSNAPKKKKQSAKQCELEENVIDGKIEIFLK